MSELSDRDKARRRQWHIDRARVRGVMTEGSSLAASRMDEKTLWHLLTSNLSLMGDQIYTGRDVRLAQLLGDTYAVAQELKMRGVQLQLPT